MAIDRLTEILRQTLQDDLLSRNERALLLEEIIQSRLTSADLEKLRSLVFDLIRPRFSTPEQVHLLDWLEDVQKVILRSQSLSDSSPRSTGESDACFSPGMECVSRIRGLFRSARESADVCVFTITDDRITEEILAAHRRGVRIRLITDNEKAFDPGSDIETLQQAGLSVRVDRTPYHMHHKFALFDGKRLLTGSYNWTRGAAEQNEENLIVTADSSLISQFSACFEQLWASIGGGR